MSDLTDRMRTCAAHILGVDAADRVGPDDRSILDVRTTRDAADLLIEAADALEAAPAPPGEPMAIIPPIVAQPQPPEIPTQVWTDLALPTLQRSGTTSPRACPQCDSRANKTVRFVNKRMMITCQVCGNEWELK